MAHPVAECLLDDAELSRDVCDRPALVNHERRGVSAELLRITASPASAERIGRPGRSLVLTSNRAPSDWYQLFPNAVVGESTLDRLINTSHHLLMEGRSYRPNRRPKLGSGR